MTAAPEVRLTPPPVPAPGEIDAILIQIAALIGAEAGTPEEIERIRWPLTSLNEAQTAVLIAWAYHDAPTMRLRWRPLESRARLAGYNAERLRGLRCSEFVDAAKAIRARVTEHERGLRNRAEEERTRRREQAAREAAERRASASATAERAMTPDEMVDSESSILVSAGRLLINRPGRIWRDDFHGENFTNWDGTADDSTRQVVAVTDDFYLRVHVWLHMTDPAQLSKTTPQVSRQAINYVADHDRRNEVVAYLDGLRWDGEVRLAGFFARACGTPDDEYHRRLSRNWFISMAARAKQPGCEVHVMPVLFGRQGIGKTSLLKIIGGKWYTAITTAAQGKEFQDVLRGKWVCEIPELDSIASTRAEISTVKALISNSVDTFRPSYGHAPMAFKRTCVFAGTTNDAGWHRDDTGGRRFGPVNCSAIDLPWVAAARDQLFAEAMAALAAGETWWELPAEAHAEQVSQHYVEHGWLAIIRAALDAWTEAGTVYDSHNGVEATVERAPAEPGGNMTWGTMVTSRRLMTGALNIPSERQTRNHASQISSVMRNLGWEHTNVRERRTQRQMKAWVRVAANIPNAEIVSDEELPF